MARTDDKHNLPHSLYLSILQSLRTALVRSARWASPVNNRDNGPNPRIATLHCVIVRIPNSQGDCGKLPMLTDIFARRYEQPRMWETFYEESRRLLVQGCQLLNDVCPYYVDGKENGKDFWTRIHDLLARELSLKELSTQHWGFYNKQNLWQGCRHTTATMIETWKLDTY